MKLSLEVGRRQDEVYALHTLLVTELPVPLSQLKLEQNDDV